jgi:DNA-binding LacI/PurR family transcriptional regulator
MSSSPTLEDVAALSRTSRATVSRVINGQPGVHLATERRVWQAVRALNYKPHRMARALATGQSALIALIMPRRIFLSGDRFALMAIDLVHTVVSHAHYAVQLCIWDNEYDCQAIETYLGGNHLFDGIVLITSNASAMLTQLLEDAATPCAKIEYESPAQPSMDAQIITTLDALLKRVSERRHSPIPSALDHAQNL